MRGRLLFRLLFVELMRGKCGPIFWGACFARDDSVLCFLILCSPFFVYLNTEGTELAELGNSKARFLNESNQKEIFRSHKAKELSSWIPGF